MITKGLKIISIVLCFIGVGYTQSIEDMSEDELMPLLEDKTTRRINDLEAYIKTIGDKSRNEEIREAAINAAVKLFMDEDNIFQVSSKNNSKINEFKIRDYFWKLLVLPYKKVEIDWYKTIWISKLRKGLDDKYYGKVRVYQVFKGIGLDGIIKYEDFTSKDIDVQIEVINKDLGEKSKQVLILKLGDVRVIETR